MRLPADRSPCRGERHPCSVEHADTVYGYRAWVQSWTLEAERATGGYDTEMADYLIDNPRPTFLVWLLNRKDHHAQRDQAPEGPADRALAG